MRYQITGDGHEVVVDVAEPSANRFRVRVGQKEYDVEWIPLLGASHRRLRFDGASMVVAVEQEAVTLGVTIGPDHFDLAVRPALPIAPRGARAAAEQALIEVRAPMPGLVVSMEVQPGRTLTAGETVAVIEAMKMQMEIRAPAAGTVDEVRAGSGREVAAGEVIATLKPGGGR